MVSKSVKKPREKFTNLAKKPKGFNAATNVNSTISVKQAIAGRKYYMGLSKAHQKNLVALKKAIKSTKEGDKNYNSYVDSLQISTEAKNVHADKSLKYNKRAKDLKKELNELRKNEKKRKKWLVACQEPKKTHKDVAIALFKKYIQMPSGKAKTTTKEVYRAHKINFIATKKAQNIHTEELAKVRFKLMWRTKGADIKQAIKDGGPKSEKLNKISQKRKAKRIISKNKK